MTDIADLERRVIALEAAQGDNSKTLNWVVGTLGRVAGDLVSFRHETNERLDKVEAEVAGLRNDMPTIVADAMREVLRENK